MDSDTDVEVNSDTASSEDESCGSSLKSDTEDDQHHESGGRRSVSTSNSSQEAAGPDIRENTSCRSDISVSSYDTDLKPTISNTGMITSEIRTIQSEASQSNCVSSSLIPSTSGPDTTPLSLVPSTSLSDTTPSSLVPAISGSDTTPSSIFPFTSGPVITRSTLVPSTSMSDRTPSSHVSSTDGSGTTPSSLIPSTVLADTTPSSIVPSTSGPDKRPSSIVPSTSGANSLRPVGGSVVISTEENTLEASGDQVLEMTGALMQRARDSDYTLSMESVQQALTGAKEVHFNMSRTDIHKPTAVTIGGDVHVRPSPQRTRAPEPQGPPNHLQKLKTETEKTFKKWTEGMVKTKASETILKKNAQGRTWVTVTGCPGEGKTTAGYMVLKHLHDRGREVFDIKTPDDYFKVKDIKQSVIMLNDIFGALSYDSDRMKKWQNVLSDVLALSEHKQEDNDTSHRVQNKKIPDLAVILICRSSILKEASKDMGRYKHLVIQKENVVDVTELMKCEASERIKIWKYHASRHNVNIDSRLVREVCSLDLSHGFPHCCRLFADMYSKNNQLDMKHFFTKPLEFLQQSMESLMKDFPTGALLREMLKHDGSLDLDSVCDFERQYQFSSIAETLEDTYLTLNGRTIEFHHPSVYDCAAFVICQKVPSFVIAHCSLPFLNERVRVKGLQEEKVHRHPILLVDSVFDKSLLERFHKEFEERNIEDVLSHSSFFDECFVLKFMEKFCSSNTSLSLSERIHDLFDNRDKHSNKSFLFLMTKSGSDKILRYIHQYVELTEEEQSKALFGACEHSSVSSLQFLLQRYKDINLEVTDNDNQTPLLIATRNRSQDVIRTLLMSNVNVNTTDKTGKTPLSNVCRHGVDGDGSVLQIMLVKNADTTVKLQVNDSYQAMSPFDIACQEGHTNIVSNMLEVMVYKAFTSKVKKEMTPIHYACKSGHADVVSLLLERGANFNTINHSDNTPFHDACLNGHVDIVSLLLNKGADFNRPNVYGNTPLHATCLNGHVDIATLLLNKGAQFNKTNSNGDTALHAACRYGHVAIVTLLLDKGANFKIKNRHGNTPLHEASRYGHVEVLSLLLDKGADFNIANRKGNTPLHYACQHGHRNCLLLLLNTGADVNAKNIAGDTPYHTAKWNCRSKILSLFHEIGIFCPRLNRPRMDFTFAANEWC